ncbi:MAG TPA: EcsC family protein [Woeseiaceae bacterium]|nr:EcsC family protein [Woeseiaceae bacterium]
MTAIPQLPTLISSGHAQELREARQVLQHPSLVIRLSSLVGTRVENLTKELGKRLPEDMTEVISRSSNKAIESAFHAAIRTIQQGDTSAPRNRLHQAAVVTTGGVAGFLGLHALLVELPITTLIMFRSIADIARANGESLADPETQLNCLTVFALGSPRSDADEGAETSYYGVRYALSRLTTDALQYITAHGTTGRSAPVMVRFVSAIASRFGVVVSQKAAAQAVPAIGAIGGAVTNAVFMSHFQDMARAHFTIRRLERIYGKDAVEELYVALADEIAE